MMKDKGRVMHCGDGHHGLMKRKGYQMQATTKGQGGLHSNSLSLVLKMI
jgi:hypothetical protein